MTGWTPLYQQIVGSSIWEAKDHVRLAWITLLAVSNKDGVASVTTSGLARLANISLENSEDAIRVLSSPDPDTLTQAHEGRRIERCEDGWKLLNFQKYREKAKKAALREYNAAKQAQYRSAKEQRVSEGENGSPKGYHPNARTVLHLLNEASCSRFREVDTNLSVISARLSEEGVDLVGMRMMIERQCKRWKGSKMLDYLRPTTLFGKEKFDGYYAAKDQPIYEGDKPATGESKEIQEQIDIPRL